MGKGMKMEPIRLCGTCYGESPYHRIEWQLKSVDRCQQHQLRLLSECPLCGARFKAPALWVDGWCRRCFTTFGKMKELQKSIYSLPSDKLDIWARGEWWIVGGEW